MVSYCGNIAAAAGKRKTRPIHPNEMSSWSPTRLPVAGRIFGAEDSRSTAIYSPEEKISGVPCFQGLSKTPTLFPVFSIRQQWETFYQGKDDRSNVRDIESFLLSCIFTCVVVRQQDCQLQLRLFCLLSMRPRHVRPSGSQDHCEFCKLLPLPDCLCCYPPSSCTCSKRSKVLLQTLSNVSRNPMLLKYALHRPSTRDRLRSLIGYLDGPLETEVINDWWTGPEKNIYTVW